MTFALNADMPGTDALLLETLHLDKKLYDVDDNYWGPDDGAVVFEPEFFSQGALHRVISLGAHALGAAARWDDYVAAPYSAESEAQRESLRAFAALGRPRAILDANAIRPWMPKGASPELVKEVLQAIAMVPPTDPTDVARWVLDSVQKPEAQARAFV